MANEAIANGVIDTSPGKLDAEEIMQIVGYTGKALFELFVEKNPMGAFTAAVTVVKTLGYGDKLKDLSFMDLFTASAAPKK